MGRSVPFGGKADKKKKGEKNPLKNVPSMMQMMMPGTGGADGSRPKKKAGGKK
jgi:hypothetical protein